VTRLDSYGISVALPAGWEGEIYRRPPAVEGLRAAGAPGAGEAAGAPDGEPDGEPPVVHAASFALPPERGDFGNGAVDLMGADDVFVSLFEYDPASATTPLFASSGVPRLDDADFAPTALQRAFPGHSGCQRFFHVGRRAFCLYVVLGSHRFRTRQVRRVNALLDGLQIA
jgi:hypothetical protein